MSVLHEFDLKSPVWFQTKITWHHVQLSFNYMYIHFEIAFYKQKDDAS